MDTITSSATSLASALDDATQAASNLATAAAAAAAPAPAPATAGAAGGGLIRGPGSATSDSILARLSDGEFVQSARAVQFYGTDLMHALNNLQFPRFSAGGIVGLFSPPLPRFAAGGPVNVGNQSTAQINVDLRTDHGSVSVMATPDAAAQLQRLAATKTNDFHRAQALFYRMTHEARTGPLRQSYQARRPPQAHRRWNAARCRSSTFTSTR